ncbi:right-handed parallel beta-helix repeat-containing protein [Sedimentisphaera salicampi]|uniref:Right handed beta helix domain-containing protein n=1 Tax=Sedimentisphaera salicampi TaxID=1941349 RepID=A0A1W6LLG6_9BACT|nr:right-handed parallel beta-helix repeat-containing protein [Sedimentisphaera salicampi]ARN56605.1 hypothetical protein STSP1_00991 [Sedimentisphaera salicampi]
MKFTKKSVCISIAFLFVLSFSAALSAGELEPSAPPSSGTMKTLDEVEPRIPIPGSETPVSTFEIEESGSYYLTGSRVCSSTGIYIGSGVNNVTIDLSGCTLSAVEGSTGTGILMQSCRNVSILNGTVEGFANCGIAEYNSYGNAKGHRIFGVTVAGTGAAHTSFDAISLSGGKHIIENCIIRDNSNDGIVLSSGGGTVRNNDVSNNGSNGIVVYRRNNVEGNRCCWNGDSGINSNGPSIIKDNVCISNEEKGIQTQDGCRIIGNLVSSNYNYGIYAGDNCCIKGNTANSNGSGGIHGTYNCLFVDNVACENSTYGIHASSDGYIDSNTAVDNGNSNIYSAGSTLGSNHAP